MCSGADTEKSVWPLLVCLVCIDAQQARLCVSRCTTLLMALNRVHRIGHNQYLRLCIKHVFLLCLFVVLQPSWVELLDER